MSNTSDDTPHYESLYHCLECRQVYYLEETDDKVVETCDNCGPGTFFKIPATQLVGGEITV